jgi:hypothetical protein
MNITTTLDPMSLNDASHSDIHLQDGDLDIYFETIENLDEYQTLHVERPGRDLTFNLDNPTDEHGTDWN